MNIQIVYINYTEHFVEKKSSIEACFLRCNLRPCDFPVILTNWHCISVPTKEEAKSCNWSKICNAVANDIWGFFFSISAIWSWSSKLLSSLLISVSSGSVLNFSMRLLCSISFQPFFYTLIGISDVSTSSSNGVHWSDNKSMVKLFRRSSNYSAASSASRGTSENSLFWNSDLSCP